MRTRKAPLTLEVIGTRSLRERRKAIAPESNALNFYRECYQCKQRKYNLVHMQFTIFLGAFHYVYSEVAWLKYRIEEIDSQGATYKKSFDAEVLRVPSDYCLSEIKAK